MSRNYCGRLIAETGKEWHRGPIDKGRCSSCGASIKGKL